MDVIENATLRWVWFQFLFVGEIVVQASVELVMWLNSGED
jgi:hypothetical protein